MTRTLPLAALSLALLAGAALAAGEPNTPTSMPQVQAQMKAVVDKTSTDLFNTAGAADPANGPDQQLPDAAGWTRIKTDADKLKAAADWLQDPKNGKTAEPAWMKAAQSMSALSAAASKAAAAHDAKGLAQAANDLSDTCTACHSVYKKQS
jgi:cytochrome c556